MAIETGRPKLEGNMAVGEDRQVDFAEFGDPQGRAVFRPHGAPAPVDKFPPRPGSMPRTTTSG